MACFLDGNRELLKVTLWNASRKHWLDSQKKKKPKIWKWFDFFRKSKEKWLPVPLEWIELHSAWLWHEYMYMRIFRRLFCLLLSLLSLVIPCGILSIGWHKECSMKFVKTSDGRFFSTNLPFSNFGKYSIIIRMDMLNPNLEDNCRNRLHYLPRSVRLIP